MEIGLYAESAGLSSLDETLPRARDLGITRIELSTGGQNHQPFLDVDQLLESDSATSGDFWQRSPTMACPSPRSMSAPFRFTRKSAPRTPN